MAELILDPVSQTITVPNESPSISVRWNDVALQAVTNTRVGPTVASRSYGILHTAMFDAWASYDPVAIPTQESAETLQRPGAENTDDNKTEAMSFAAYQVLTELFPSQEGLFADLMTELGFDPTNESTDASTAAGLGNTIAETLMAVRRNDGSNQLNGYVDNTGYTPTNQTDELLDITAWTPERVPIDAEPGTELRTQSFLTPQWGFVTPFALTEGSDLRPSGPEPFFTDAFADSILNFEEQTITLPDGTEVAVSQDLVGTIINPGFIAQAEEVVSLSGNLTDTQKLIAEFWEDGGGTPFPPGTWMRFGEFVSARDSNTLDEDAVLFFALGNAVFDAGIATWEAKRFYDYTRPVRAIRSLGELELIGEPGTDALTGETGYVIEAWGGPGLGTQTILAENFLTYQTPGADPSPPFSEYTSGHSAFSAAGATILELFTGSSAFGGSVTFEPGDSRFEPGLTPQAPVTLEWDTFRIAADEAGLSRLYGGIHFTDGDLDSRQLGVEAGEAVWEQVQFFVNGGLSDLVFGTPDGDTFDGGVTPDFTGIDTVLFTGAGDDVVDLAAEGVENRVLGGSGTDELIAGQRDRLFGGSDDDVLEASAGAGGNRLYGGDGNDELVAGTGDRLLGGPGDDTFFLNALGSEGGDNRAYGQSGNDVFFLGTGDRVVGDDGNDQFFATTGGENTLTGGDGADEFWVVNSELPDTENTITDFEAGVDVIGISLTGVTSVADLSLSQDGSDGLISIGTQIVARFLNLGETVLQDPTNYAFL